MTKLNPEHLGAVADALEEIARLLETDEQQTSHQKTALPSDWEDFTQSIARDGDFD